MITTPTLSGEPGEAQTPAGDRSGAPAGAGDARAGGAIDDDPGYCLVGVDRAGSRRTIVPADAIPL